MNTSEQEMKRPAAGNEMAALDGRPAGRRSRGSIWFRRLLWLAVVLFVVWQGAGFMVAYDYLSRDHHHPTPSETPADRGLSAIALTIPVDPPTSERRIDGIGGGAEQLDLAAWLLPADPMAADYQGGATIVMLHGFGSTRGRIWLDPVTETRCSLFDQGAESLWRAGFHVVMLDFRNHGDSGDRGVVTLGFHEREDVLAVLNYLQSDALPVNVEIDTKRIGLRGGSMGGVTALLAAAELESGAVAAIWVDSAFADADAAIGDFLTHFEVPSILLPPVKFWLQQLSGIRLDQVQPVRILDQIDCPILITHSQDDTIITPQHFQRYEEVARHLPNVETWLVAGVQHHRLLFVPGYIDRQRAFFLQHLGSQ